MKLRLVRGFCISVTYLLWRAGRSMQRLAFANNCLPRRNYARQQHQCEHRVRVKQRNVGLIRACHGRCDRPPQPCRGCGARRVSIAEKAPAKCARKENRVGRHVILPIFDVPSHSVRRTPSELRAKNGSILRFSAYVMRDSRYVKRLMYLLSHTSVGRQMNNGKNRVPSHRNGVRPATIGAEGTTCRPGGPRDPA